MSKLIYIPEQIAVCPECRSPLVIQGEEVDCVRSLTAQKDVSTPLAALCAAFEYELYRADWKIAAEAATAWMREQRFAGAA